jgi:hypothetical protein
MSTHRHLRRYTGRPAVAAALGATLAACALAPVALAASLTSPATAAIGGRVSVRATGLIAGRYQLFLAYTEKQTKGGQAINCSASIGSIKTVKQSATFSGTIPSKLVCRTGAGPSLGTQPVSGGRYDLAVGSPVGAGVFDGNKSFLQHTVTITG